MSFASSACLSAVERIHPRPLPGDDLDHRSVKLIPLADPDIRLDLNRLRMRRQPRDVAHKRPILPQGRKTQNVNGPPQVTTIALRTVGLQLRR